MDQKEKILEKQNSVERWKRYVVAGNECLIKQDLRMAARQYELARQCAEGLFKKSENPEEGVSALVVTYHNIADLQRKQGNSSSILYYLKTVHDIVLRSLLTTNIKGKRHKALLNASKRTYSALVSYKKCGVYY